MAPRSLALAPVAPSSLAVRGVLELAAVALTAGLHLAWPALGLPRAVLVIPLVLGWGGYVAHRARHAPSTLDAWGLRREGLREAARATALPSVLALGAMAAYGAVAGHAFPWWAALCLLTYPLWGLVQQLLLHGLVTRNLLRLPGPLGHPVTVTLLVAAGFGAVHRAEPVLVGATFLLGLVVTPLWMRWRNLWPLAVAHGWLGTAVYYLVMGQDPVMTYFVAGSATP